MIEVLGMATAVLLVLCLLLIAAVLGYKAQLAEAKQDVKHLDKELSRLAKMWQAVEHQADENATKALEANKKYAEAVEEITRLTGELAVAKLSIKNAQNQVAEHVETCGRAIADREEYRGMLKDIAHIFANEKYLLQEVLKERQDFEAQGG